MACVRRRLTFIGLCMHRMPVSQSLVSCLRVAARLLRAQRFALRMLMRTMLGWTGNKEFIMTYRNVGM